MAEEWVEIKYPGIEGVARVTLDAFDKVYKAKGWKLSKPNTPVVKEYVKKPTKKAESKDE